MKKKIIVNKGINPIEQQYTQEKEKFLEILEILLKASFIRQREILRSIQNKKLQQDLNELRSTFTKSGNQDIDKFIKSIDENILNDTIIKVSNNDLDTTLNQLKNQEKALSGTKKLTRSIQISKFFNYLSREEIEKIYNTPKEISKDLKIKLKDLFINGEEVYELVEKNYSKFKILFNRSILYEIRKSPYFKEDLAQYLQEKIIELLKLLKGKENNSLNEKIGFFIKENGGFKNSYGPLNHLINDSSYIFNLIPKKEYKEISIKPTELELKSLLNFIKEIKGNEQFLLKQSPLESVEKLYLQDFIKSYKEYENESEDEKKRLVSSLKKKFLKIDTNEIEKILRENSEELNKEYQSTEIPKNKEESKNILEEFKYIRKEKDLKVGKEHKKEIEEMVKGEEFLHGIILPNIKVVRLDKNKDLNYYLIPLKTKKGVKYVLTSKLKNVPLNNPTTYNKDFGFEKGKKEPFNRVYYGTPATKLKFNILNSSISKKDILVAKTIKENDDKAFESFAVDLLLYKTVTDKKTNKKKQAILLIKRPDKDNKFAIPGGMVDPGESFQSAALREMEEETELNLNKIHLIGTLAQIRAAERKEFDKRHIGTTVFFGRYKGPLSDANRTSEGIPVWVSIEKALKISNWAFPDHKKFIETLAERIKLAKGRAAKRRLDSILTPKERKILKLKPEKTKKSSLLKMANQLQQLAQILEENSISQIGFDSNLNHKDTDLE